MFDTIILLTGLLDDSSLSALLRHYNPQLDVRSVGNLNDLDALSPGLWAHARLLSFVTSVVVPARILDQIGFGAYNFHPGPPHYPGWLPAHFAIYGRATCFGATAHVMIEKVDAGPIVGVGLFSVPKNASVPDLERLAFTEAVNLFWRLAPPLATRGEPLTELPIKWSGRRSTRRQYAAMCDIPLDIAKDDLERRIAAFGAGHFGLSPTIALHGHTFRYVPADGDGERIAADVASADTPSSPFRMAS